MFPSCDPTHLFPLQLWAAHDTILPVCIFPTVLFFCSVASKMMLKDNIGCINLLSVLLSEGLTSYLLFLMCQRYLCLRAFALAIFCLKCFSYRSLNICLSFEYVHICNFLREALELVYLKQPCSPPIIYPITFYFYYLLLLLYYFWLYLFSIPTSLLEKGTLCALITGIPFSSYKIDTDEQFSIWPWSLNFAFKVTSSIRNYTFPMPYKIQYVICKPIE